MKKLFCAILLLAAPALADAPTIDKVEANQNGDTWRFDVTISHPDTGWDHYADGWRIETPDGTELGFRELLHPHVSEQPFTRSLTGVSIPSGTDTVHIRSRCIVDGWSEAEYSLPLSD